MSAERPGAVSASAASYEVDGALSCSELTSIDAGTSLLVSGPAMTRKTDLVLSLLETGFERGQHAIVVSPDIGVARIRDRVGPTDQLRVVDSTGTGGSFDDTELVKFVSSPGDLTGIGIGLAKCNQAIGAAAEAGVRVGVLSLSTLIQYAGLDSVFSFVHVLTGRVDAAGYFGVFALDRGTHDDRVTETLAPQFDGVIEVRESDTGQLEGRVLGLDGASREWAAF